MKEVRRAESFQYWAGKYSVINDIRQDTIKEILKKISWHLEKKHRLELVITEWDNKDAYAFSIVPKDSVPNACKKCPYTDCDTCKYNKEVHV